MRRAIILGAGFGKRMKSTMPKVLHELCGRSMLWYIVTELRHAGVDEVTVVASDALALALDGHDLGDLRIVRQAEPLGTGHAVRVALEALETRDDGRVLVVSGDMPLLDAVLFRRIFESLGGGTTMSLATVELDHESTFGRIIRDDTGAVERIVEHKDCTDDEALVTEMNAGCYAFVENALREVIGDIGNVNAQNEYYLTDSLALMRGRGHVVAPVRIAKREHALGVNDRIELALARRAMNQRLCEQYMRAGVTIIDPATTYLEPELEIGVDTVIYPNTAIGRLSTVGAQCVVGPNTRFSNAHVGERSAVRESVIIDSTVGANCVVGPFAHLREETVLADDVRVGNFVEVKRSELASGVRAGHLSYLGDAEVGRSTNIGAGTITCNYDGERKHRTEIGANTFIGSNSSLIAPLKIGDGALTGAGSVVTRNVPDGTRVVGNPAKPLASRKGEHAWH